MRVENNRILLISDPLTTLQKVDLEKKKHETAAPLSLETGRHEDEKYRTVVRALTVNRENEITFC